MSLSHSAPFRGFIKSDASVTARAPAKPKLYQFRGGNGLADYFVLASIAICLTVLAFVGYVVYYVAVENYTPACTSRRKNKACMY